VDGDRAKGSRSDPSIQVAVRGHGNPSLTWRLEMANPVPAGSDVSAGTYRCTNCGNQIEVGSTRHLPPFPSCGNGEYDTVSGGDSTSDPYPDRS
jgi:Zinc-ribbon containing domain